MEESAAVDAALQGPLEFHAELEALVAASPGWPGEIGTSVARAFDAGGSLWPVMLVAAFVVGMAGERLGCWKLNAFNRLIAQQRSDRWVVSFGYALFRVVFDLAGVLLFGLFAWIALYALLDRGLPAYATLNGLLVGIGALLAGKAKPGEKTIVLMSGKNIDMQKHRQIINEEFGS